jgi:hypothetical protein
MPHHNGHAVPHPVTASLLRLSAGERLALAAVAVAAIWAGVWWALT